MTANNYPDWMLSHPHAPENPKLEVRRFRGIELSGWVGYVNLEDIDYWIENRRTDLALARYRDSGLPNDQIVNLLIDDPDLEIERLAKNILLNELRHPLVLSYYRELLDGNRRYLAHQWIKNNGASHEQEKHSIIKAWVLDENSSQTRDKLRIVTEYNFLDDFRKEWSDFVKASVLHERYYDGREDHTYKSLYEIYGGPGFTQSKLREFVKTFEVIIAYVEDTPEHFQDQAWQTAADNFIWFQQLQRSYTDLIRNDEEFQQVVFDNIRNGDVRTTDHLKNLKDVRRFREAWKLFRDGEVQAAHLIRQVLVEEEQRRTEPDQLMEEINGRLERLVNEPSYIDRVSEEKRRDFHKLSLSVPGQGGDVHMRVDHIVRQLQAITSVELASLPEEYIAALETALDDVIRQARASKEE